ncbi:transporter substrate-binding domain-containing protein [Streptomyces sp. ISL-1]|nr:transporter substrate-binding domain-containing protein [Streptomyces sp. ISL-1]
MSRIPLTQRRIRPSSSRLTPGVAVSLFALVGLLSCSAEPEPEFLGRERVTVAMHNDLPGLSYVDDHGHSGLDYLLFKHVREELDVEFSDPVPVSSRDRIAQLVSKRADMTIASFSITPQRMLEIDFVGPYLKTWQGFLVGPDGADVQTMDDLRGKRVCTWDGTTSQETVDDTRITSEWEPVVKDDASDCIEALLGGQVAAVSTDQTILYGFAQHHAKDGLRVVPDLKVGAPQYYGIGIPKGHRGDCLELAAWLKTYVGSSTWSKDIDTSLPLLAEGDPERINEHKPSTDAIDARSCRDKASP